MFLPLLRGHVTSNAHALFETEINRKIKREPALAVSKVLSIHFISMNLSPYLISLSVDSQISN